MADPDFRKMAREYADRVAPYAHDAFKIGFAHIYVEGVLAALRACFAIADGARLNGAGVRAQANREAIDQIRRDISRAIRSLHEDAP